VLLFIPQGLTRLSVNILQREVGSLLQCWILFVTLLSMVVGDPWTEVENVVKANGADEPWQYARQLIGGANTRGRQRAISLRGVLPLAAFKLMAYI